MQTREVPEGGMCLSVFVVLSKKEQPHSVLLGRLNVTAPWDHIGALDPPRAEANSKGWMLPSSHLILGESPEEASRRVLREQLGLADQTLTEPTVFSEVYGASNHWDLDFIFGGERESIGPHAAWRELRFVDLNLARKDDMARSHEDILAAVGKWKAR